MLYAFVKVVRNEFGEAAYTKVIYNDSKLNAGTVWSKNQKTEVINFFRDNPGEEFIVMEVSIIKSLKDLELSIEQGAEIRLYRQDVYKSISDGNGKIGKSINMNDWNCNNKMDIGLSCNILFI